MPTSTLTTVAADCPLTIICYDIDYAKPVLVRCTVICGYSNETHLGPPVYVRITPSHSIFMDTVAVRLHGYHESKWHNSTVPQIIDRPIVHFFYIKVHFIMRSSWCLLHYSYQYLRKNIHCLCFKVSTASSNILQLSHTSCHNCLSYPIIFCVKT